MTLEKQKEFIHSPRSASKSYKALQEFIKVGREGKIAVYRTAQGDFLSPAAVEAYKNEEVEKARYSILEDLLLLPKFIYNENDRNLVQGAMTIVIEFLRSKYNLNSNKD